MATAEPILNGAPTSPNLLPTETTSIDPSPTVDADSTADNSTPAADPPSQDPETVVPNTGETTAENPTTTTPPEKKWPGWPGDCVFRLIVPVGKVGSIIGRKGELIKKMCEETHARVRVLDAAVGTPDRIVLVSGKEEPEAALSPAMDAALRVFKRVSGLSETDGEIKGSAGATYCSIRLLVASTQAINLIGKQGSLIRSMQENTGASVRVLSGDEAQFQREHRRRRRRNTKKEESFYIYHLQQPQPQTRRTLEVRTTQIQCVCERETTGMQGELELPPGFRFHPTDEELVNHYLCRKCAGQPISVPVIKEIDLYKFDPWHLPELGFQSEKEWYFFSPRDRKYPNGSRPNRAAGSGYWKATGADKPIGKPKPLGIKKALVFYAGKAPKGVKTNWIMHEYRLANVDRSAGKKNNLRLDDWVLCRIYNKKGKIEKHNNAVTPEYLGEVHNYYEQEHEHEHESKPVIMHKIGNDQLYTDTSDSVPRLHTDSSSSGHVVSPDGTCDREVQSEPKWNELDLQLDDSFNMFEFNYLDNNLSMEEDPFGTQIQYQMNQLSPLQDMFMYQ